MFAYIPARGGSKRVPKKNLYKLDGIPLLVRVIKNLQKLNFISDIFVSTDSEEIKEVAEKNNAKCLDLRDETLSNDKSGFIDLIKFDIPRYINYQNGDSEILFTLATAALVPPKVYKNAHNIYKTNKPEILMSCEEYTEPIWWAMKKKKDGYWTPIYPDAVLKNSQDFEKNETDSGLFYFFNQKVLANYSSHKIVNKLMVFDVPFEYRCDVNNSEDINLLELKYHYLKSLK